jgi:hypothetical protein
MIITLDLTSAELATLQGALFARAGALKADFIARPSPAFIDELEAVVALLAQTTGPTALDAAQG